MLLVRRRGRDEFEARFLCPSGSMNSPARATQRSAIVLPKRSLRIGAQASSRFARIGTPRRQPAGFMATDGVSRAENLIQCIEAGASASATWRTLGSSRERDWRRGAILP